MSEHRIRLVWNRATPEFDYKSYNREHFVTFKNGQHVQVSAAIAYRGSAECVDPEEAFVASIASCHMLTFLAIASRGNLIVNVYEDEAVGIMARNDRGKLAITRVTLRPRIVFEPGAAPDAARLARMHDESHDECFIANSITTEVVVESAEMPVGRS